MNTSKPLILIDPLPRTVPMCFDAAAKDRLAALGRLVVHESARMPAVMVEEHLAEVEVLIGQTDMPAERLERAKKLRAIINIEGNFLPNVDYATCFRRGIWVLNASPVFAETVAEMALGMMLDLARGISAADRAFREGREVWGLESNKESFLIRGPAGRPDRLWRSRPHVPPPACAVRMPHQGLRSLAAGPSDPRP
jgi:phosphoglycerate dehydrogenase-like enzyme